MRTQSKSGEKVAYRPAEVHAAYGIPKTTVFALLKNGKLKSVKIGRARLILRSSLDALLQEAA